VVVAVARPSNQEIGLTVCYSTLVKTLALVGVVLLRLAGSSQCRDTTVRSGRDTEFDAGADVMTMNVLRSRRCVAVRALHRG
jgi:hypothetical protein